MGIVAHGIGPKSFGTFEKQAPSEDVALTIVKMLSVKIFNQRFTYCVNAPLIQTVTTNLVRFSKLLPKNNFPLFFQSCVKGQVMPFANVKNE